MHTLVCRTSASIMQYFSSDDSEYEREKWLHESLIDFGTYLALKKMVKKRKTSLELFKRRHDEGAFNVLIQRHLIDNELKFVAYFRLTPHLFTKIFELIESDLLKVPTNFISHLISPKEKLCITIRYL